MKLLNEVSFKASMETDVEPFLKQCEKELWFDRIEYQKIHCMKYSAENARGVVMISHGFTESAEKYKEVIYYFLKENYHVYIPEHCGHGYSYRLCEDLSMVHIDTFERYVEDFAYVAQYVKKEHELPVYLFAHSMGGAIGALTAAKYPKLFQKIILNSPMIRPSTGKLPWNLIKMTAFVGCMLGKGKKYIPGHHKYEGLEDFEESCSTSRKRFEYYNEKKAATEAYQTSGASYSWMLQTSRIYDVLIKQAYRKIKVPVLMFQAERDTVVSAKAQEIFMKKLRQAGNYQGKLLIIPDAKHEIYNSKNHVLEKYWKKVFSFLI